MFFGSSEKSISCQGDSFLFWQLRLAVVNGYTEVRVAVNQTKHHVSIAYADKHGITLSATSLLSQTCSLFRRY